MSDLPLLFHDYLNPDWDLDAPTTNEIVGRFADDLSLEELIAARDEARALLARELSEEVLEKELEARRLIYYLPSSEGHTHLSWLDMVSGVLNDACARRAAHPPR